RRPEAGAVGSAEQVIVTYTERGAISRRSYQGYYPSAHFTYKLKDDVLLRVAYAKTYGRPPFTSIIPRTIINEVDWGEEEPDPDAAGGTLSVRNGALKPWSADNFDLSVEYYTPTGGVLSGGVFLKDIKDFFGNAARLATLADL